jgi:hypothetical protein
MIYLSQEVLNCITHFYEQAEVKLLESTSTIQSGCKLSSSKVGYTQEG